MIKLIKIAAPQILTDRGEEWTAALLAIDASEKVERKKAASKYSHDDIKNTLLLETFDKCAYCESKFRHVTYGDIEHVSPKSIQPELTFVWANLTIACDICNTKKADTEYGVIVDPYIDDPFDHIRFGGAVIFAKPGSEKGEATERILTLNRLELIERRMEKLQYIRDSLSNIAKTQRQDVKIVLQLDFDERELVPQNEFSAMVRTFIKSME